MERGTFAGKKRRKKRKRKKQKKKEKNVEKNKEREKGGGEGEREREIHLTFSWPFNEVNGLNNLPLDVYALDSFLPSSGTFSNTYPPPFTLLLSTPPPSKESTFENISSRFLSNGFQLKREMKYQENRRERSIHPFRSPRFLSAPAFEGRGAEKQLRFAKRRDTLCFSFFFSFLFFFFLLKWHRTSLLKR